jgi:hypothetical protein
MGRSEAMTRNQVMDLVFAELKAAEAKHPTWPDDPIYGAAIVAEEAGELIQASIDWTYKKNEDGTVKNNSQMIKEAIQTAAMGIRFLLNLCE